MNKIITFFQENFFAIKSNLTGSSITILSTILIAKLFLFPYIRAKKKTLDFLRIKINILLKYCDKNKLNKPNNLIFMSYLNHLIKTFNEDEAEEIDFQVDEKIETVTKIKKTKKIIKKLTNEFLKEEETKKPNTYESRKDKIFYLLLNNMHFINNNNLQKNNNLNNYNNEVVANS